MLDGVENMESCATKFSAVALYFSLAHHFIAVFWECLPYFEYARQEMGWEAGAVGYLRLRMGLYLAS